MKIKLTILIFFICTSCLYGHSGRTDSNGGHYDNINGGYHFHHGKAAHQHPDGICPYKNRSNSLWYIFGGIALISGAILFLKNKK